jgi:hypothetical protein
MQQQSNKQAVSSSELPQEEAQRPYTAATAAHVPHTSTQAHLVAPFSAAPAVVRIPTTNSRMVNSICYASVTCRSRLQ